MANISLYEREEATPGNQNPTPEVYVNEPEHPNEPPSLIVPFVYGVASLIIFKFLT